MDVQPASESSLRSFIRPRVHTSIAEPIEMASENAAVAAQVCPCRKGFIELYCSVDNELICMPCYYSLHSRCKVQSIKQLSQDIMEAKELETIIKELEVLKSAMIRVLGDKRQLTVHRGQQKRAYIKQAKKLNIRIGSDKLERDLGTKVGVLQDSLQLDKLLHRQKCRRVIREINTHFKNFAYFSEQGNASGTYIQLHKAKEDLARYMEIMNEVSDMTNETRLDANVLDLVGDYYTRDNLGNVKVSRSPTKGSTSRSVSFRSTRSSEWATIDKIRQSDYMFQSPVSRDLMGSSGLFDRSKLKTGTSTLTRASSIRSYPSQTIRIGLPQRSKLPVVKFALKNFSSKDMEDAFENHISAIAFLEDERILLIDCRNNKLKLFSRYHKCLWVLDMQRPVWDLTLTSKHQVLVTCPSDGRLQHVQISKENVLFKTGHIATMKDCRAICSVGDMLYVSYSGQNPCIRILSSEGIMYRTIHATYNNKRIMQNPLYMLVKEEGKLIYLSDYSMQQVTVIDHRGTLFHAHSVRPGWPLGMTFDKDGNIIVCVSGAKNIRMIMSDNSGSDVLVHSHVFQGDPFTVAYEHETTMLYVAFEKQSELRMMYVI